MEWTKWGPRDECADTTNWANDVLTTKFQYSDEHKNEKEIGLHEPLGAYGQLRFIFTKMSN